MPYGFRLRAAAGIRRGPAPGTSAGRWKTCAGFRSARCPGRRAAGKNPVYVGRIRDSIAFDNGLEFFCVADNLRIGAALNTVRLAQKVIEMGLY